MKAAAKLTWASHGFGAAELVINTDTGQRFSKLDVHGNHQGISFKGRASDVSNKLPDDCEATSPPTTLFQSMAKFDPTFFRIRHEKPLLTSRARSPF